MSSKKQVYDLLQQIKNTNNERIKGIYYLIKIL